MGKIGILTFWDVPNYGGWAQAYALNNVVRQLKPSSCVEHIAYLDELHFAYYYSDNLDLYNAFKANWELIPHTKRFSKSEFETAVFDTIITGSDSIWEFTAQSTNDDEHLIGNRVNTNQLIAYAASAGISAKANENKQFVKDGLLKYDAISVRDVGTQEMVKNILGKQAPIVLDPSLLYEFNLDTSVVRPAFDKYIFVYGIIWDDSFIKGLQSFAKQKSLLLISGGYKNDWCDISIPMEELSAMEWLGFIRDSVYVAASMFHGLMLSLAFGKKVFFNQHNYVKHRSTSLLEKLELPYFSKDIVDEEVLFADSFWKSWDSVKVDKKLNELRLSSRNILKSMLNENDE